MNGNDWFTWVVVAVAWSAWLLFWARCAGDLARDVRAFRRRRGEERAAAARPSGERGAVVTGRGVTWTPRI